MFISVLDLFKLGIGPSSSHTNGPMVAAKDFRDSLTKADLPFGDGARIHCILKGSLAHTGKGHGTDKAIILGLHGYCPEEMAHEELDSLLSRLRMRHSIFLDNHRQIEFTPEHDIEFDLENPLSQHPNGMIFQLLSRDRVLKSETYFSIGGGFVETLEKISTVEAPIKMLPASPYPYPFDTAANMLEMAAESDLSIAEMKYENELALAEDRFQAERSLKQALGTVWQAMSDCIERGLVEEGTLPGGLEVKRRAKELHSELSKNQATHNMNEWLCAYAMAVNEENAAGHVVVTAPTNGAAGVVPAVLYYFLKHDKPRVSGEQALSEEPIRIESNEGFIQNYLLTAAAIGGLIKHRSSISGAEVGCQGEVGSASAMAAAGLCAIKGGTPKQIENAAEIALEHHLGMTCDPVKGLVQVPCIERNGFGAIKAYTAASLALKGTGDHFMPLDACIEAMRQTGQEMSDKYKETALGGLAQSWTEC